MSIVTMGGERQSRCPLCGGVQVADPSSPYFVARPEQDFDSDWDGCMEGAA